MTPRQETWRGVARMDCSALRELSLYDDEPRPDSLYCYMCRVVEPVARYAVYDTWTLPPLHDDEIAFLGRTRCKTCHHLSSLHNEHCCVFCLVDGCDCKWVWQSGDDVYSVGS